MGTYDFVKETGRDKIWDLLEKEYRAITDPETGLIYEKFQQETRCCVCGSGESRLLWVKNGFRFVKCAGCGLVYVNPQLNEEAVLEVCREARSSDEWAEVLLTPAQLEYDERKFRAAVEEIGTMCSPGRILDVGCAVGVFLKAAKDAGWDAVGLELTKSAVKYARETLGLNVIEKTLDESGLEKESFDVITLWEVLEHINSPRTILKQARELLKPGGILLTLVPNLDSLTVRVLQEKCATFGGRDHLWYFNRDTLSRMLREEGYEPFKVSTEVGDLDTLLNYLQFEPPYIGKGETPWTKMLVGPVREMVEQMMFRLGVGYKLRIYSRKPRA